MPGSRALMSLGRWAEAEAVEASEGGRMTGVEKEALRVAQAVEEVEGASEVDQGVEVEVAGEGAVVQVATGEDSLVED